MRYVTNVIIIKDVNCVDEKIQYNPVRAVTSAMKILRWLAGMILAWSALLVRWLRWRLGLEAESPTDKTWNGKIFSQNLHRIEKIEFWVDIFFEKLAI